MKINLNQAGQPLLESGRTGKQSPTSGDTRASASSVIGEDQAQLSGTHLQVKVLTAQALQFPEIRQEKVDALRQALQAGSYRPSSTEVANAIFAHLLVKPAA